MAMHLSAATGEAITPAMLLGREEEERAAKQKEGERAVEDMLARMPAHLRAPGKDLTDGATS